MENWNAGGPRHSSLEIGSLLAFAVFASCLCASCPEAVLRPVRAPRICVICKDLLLFCDKPLFKRSPRGIAHTFRLGEMPCSGLALLLWSLLWRPRRIASTRR